MRQMKDSGIEWIGKIPESWKVIATKRLFTVISGATPKSDEIFAHLVEMNKDEEKLMKEIFEK